MSKSLQGRMMLAVGFSIALLWAVALTVLYTYTAQSETSIRDGRLQSIAIKILLSIPAGSELKMQGPGLRLRDESFPDVEHLTFQVWAGKDRLVVSTPGAPGTPLRQDFVDGATDSILSGVTWRVFSISDRTGRIYVQVGNPRSVVDDELQYKALIALGLSTLLLAFVGLLMWWAVRKTLRPVVAIAQAVRDRQKFDLTALPVTDVPTEIRPLVDSFNHLMHQLDQAVQGERRFIGDAAHELRTPFIGAICANGGRVAGKHDVGQGCGPRQAARSRRTRHPTVGAIAGSRAARRRHACAVA
ncbi:MAG: HAMP domain-containing protein [Gammaproteobacteria bacterium]